MSYKDLPLLLQKICRSRFIQPCLIPTFTFSNEQKKSTFLIMRQTKPKLLNEAALKAKCIDYLLSQHSDPAEDYVIINELKFLDGKRRADLVEVNGSMNVYEVKSDLDTLDKLTEQFTDYKNSFDTVTVVTTKKHLSNVRGLLPNNVGIILVDSEKASLIRKARPYKKFDNYVLASFLTPSQLNACLKESDVLNRSQMSTTEKRHALAGAKNLSFNNLKCYALDSLKMSHKKKYKQFLDYKTPCYTHQDDLLLFWSGSFSS